MPSIEELGQKVKAKFPGIYDDLSDADLGKKVKDKYPDAYKDFGGFAKPKSQTASQRESKRRIANIGMEQAKADQAQSDADAKARFAGTMAEGIPAAIAAPFTGGMSLAPALGAMGAAGLAGGLIRETIKSKMGSSQIPQNMRELAISLGIDTVTSVAAELGGRGLSHAIGAGRKILPQLVERSAAKAVEGERFLQDTYLQLSQKLSQGVGKSPVDIRRPLTEAYNDLNRIPKAMGKLGEEFTGFTGKAAKVVADLKADLGQLPKDVRQAAAYKKIAELLPKFEANPANKGVNRALMDQVNRLPRNNPVASTLRMNLLSGELAGARASGMTDAASEVIEGIESKMQKIGGAIASKQPLDGLIELKGSLQQSAWKESSLSGKEKIIFKQTAEKLDRVIKNQLKAYGPEAEKLYTKINSLLTTQEDRAAAVSAAEAGVGKLISGIVGRGAVGGVIGGGIGYERTHSIIGTAKGAAIGAALDVATPKIATWALEQTMRHPEAIKLMRKAIDFAVKGDKGSATTMAMRAFGTAGIRNTIKEAAKHFGSEQPDENRNPNDLYLTLQK